MASDYETQDATETLTIEGLSAIALAPIVLPAAAILEQPLAKAALKESIAFSQRCQEAVAQARERLDDAMAEIQADLGEQQQAEANGKAEQTYVPHTKAQAFTEVMDSMDDLNEQVKRLTNGVADLQVFLSIGFGALAVRQLLTKGLQLDDVPWITFAWYSFDSFVKLHDRDKSPLPPGKENAREKARMMADEA